MPIEFPKGECRSCGMPLLKVEKLQCDNCFNRALHLDEPTDLVPFVWRGESRIDAQTFVAENIPLPILQTLAMFGYKFVIVPEDEKLPAPEHRGMELLKQLMGVREDGSCPVCGKDHNDTTDALSTIDSNGRVVYINERATEYDVAHLFGCAVMQLSEGWIRDCLLAMQTLQHFRMATKLTDQGIGKAEFDVMDETQREAALGKSIISPRSTTSWDSFGADALLTYIGVNPYNDTLKPEVAEFIEFFVQRIGKEVVERRKELTAAQRG